MNAVSPLAIIISSLGAVFLVIRLIVELILSLIMKKVRKIKDGIVGKFKKKDEDTDDGEDATELSDVDDEVEEIEEPRRKPKRHKRRVPKYRRKAEDEEYDTDIILPVDRCLLNDLDD